MSDDIALASHLHFGAIRSTFTARVQVADTASLTLNVESIEAQVLLASSFWTDATALSCALRGDGISAAHAAAMIAQRVGGEEASALAARAAEAQARATGARAAALAALTSALPHAYAGGASKLTLGDGGARWEASELIRAAMLGGRVGVLALAHCVGRSWVPTLVRARVEQCKDAESFFLSVSDIISCARELGAAAAGAVDGCAEFSDAFAAIAESSAWVGCADLFNGSEGIDVNDANASALEAVQRIAESAARSCENVIMATLKCAPRALPKALRARSDEPRFGGRAELVYVASTILNATLSSSCSAWAAGERDAESVWGVATTLRAALESTPKELELLKTSIDARTVYFFADALVVHALACVRGGSAMAGGVAALVMRGGDAARAFLWKNAALGRDAESVATVLWAAVSDAVDVWLAVMSAPRRESTEGGNKAAALDDAYRSDAARFAEADALARALVAAADVEEGRADHVKTRDIDDAEGSEDELSLVDDSSSSADGRVDRVSVAPSRACTTAAVVLLRLDAVRLMRSRALLALIARTRHAVVEPLALPLPFVDSNSVGFADWGEGKHFTPSDNIADEFVQGAAQAAVELTRAAERWSRLPVPRAIFQRSIAAVADAALFRASEWVLEVARGRGRGPPPPSLSGAGVTNATREALCALLQAAGEVVRRADDAARTAAASGLIRQWARAVQIADLLGSELGQVAADARAGRLAGKPLCAEDVCALIQAVHADGDERRRVIGDVMMAQKV